MFVSTRFRDVFGSGPIKTRRTDKPVSADDSQTSSQVEHATEHLDADAIWRDITAAHRRAARVFTPELNRADDLAG